MVQTWFEWGVNPYTGVCRFTATPADGGPLFDFVLDAKAIDALIGQFTAAKDALIKAQQELAERSTRNPIEALGPVLWQAPENAFPVEPGDEPG